MFWDVTLHLCSGVAEDFGLLGCDTVSMSEWSSMLL